MLNQSMKSQQLQVILNLLESRSREDSESKRSKNRDPTYMNRCLMTSLIQVLQKSNIGDISSNLKVRANQNHKR